VLVWHPGTDCRGARCRSGTGLSGALARMKLHPGSSTHDD